MISRATGEDSEEGPDSSIVALANSFDMEYSAFIGAERLFNSIIYQAKDRDRVALYAYGVARSAKGLSYRNMKEDISLDKYYAVADNVIADADLMRSLNNRNAEDYKNPSHGTKIYKAVVALLNEN